VYDVNRYVDGFVGLRRDPSRLVFSAIVGIPPSTEEAGNLFNIVLSHPDMQPRVAADGFNLEPSCVTENGSAYPPVRIVETAAGLHASGVNVSLASICTPTFAPAIDTILARIAEAAASCE